MIGAVVGDIIGSVHEFSATKHVNFRLFDDHATFTDDSVLSIAVADCLLSGASYVDKFHEYTRGYPDRVYGASFHEWVECGSREPYNSWGNGSAMRVSAVGFASKDLDSVLAEARRSAEVTHDHPEGIKGAQATAAAIHLARSGKTKDQIRTSIQEMFEYNLARSVEEIRPTYKFDVSCQGTVPEAIIAFLDADCYESAVRLAISLGGDADTLACIAGGIADAYYGGVPADIAERGLARLDDHLRTVIDRFCQEFGLREHYEFPDSWWEV
ncbi:MAG: ADP-ribosylglycohydrolase family protein, partial [Candidatus Krumholzibacteria bacterium]|nr:ADP-ribosylglycohydrolase family protein [Candidatus Krumholzibacteria bacterium]